MPAPVSVHGSSSEMIHEGHHPNPRTIYGISKMRGEHVARLMDKMNTNSSSA
jgi:UDP-glucose 4-epimerase